VPFLVLDILGILINSLEQEYKKVNATKNNNIFISVTLYFPLIVNNGK
jgi:hypothetical protein